MNQEIQVDKPVTLVLRPETLNVVLRALELMPYGQVKGVFADIQEQIVLQFRYQKPGE